MKFDDFVKLLFPYRESKEDIDDGSIRKIRKGEFVLNLINNITIGDIPTIQNLETDTLAREKTIMSNAQLIVASGLDLPKFEGYIESLVNDGDEELAKKLESINPTADHNNYCVILADIFEKILRDFAQEKEQGKTTVKQQSSSPTIATTEQPTTYDMNNNHFIFEVDYATPNIRATIFSQQYVGDAFMADHVTNASCEACAFSESLETAMKIWHLEGRKADFSVDVIDKRIGELEQRISALRAKIASSTDSQEDEKEYKTLNTLLRNFNEETDIKRASIEFYLRNERLHTAFPPMQHTELLAYAKRLLEFSHHGWHLPNPDIHVYRIYLSSKTTGHGRSFYANIPLDVIKQVPVKYWEHRKAGDVLDGGKVFIEAVNLWYYKYLAMQVREGEDIDTDKRVRHWVGGWAFDKTS